MASGASLDTVSELYIAYYARPADPSGLQYWATQLDASSIDAILPAFANSAESTALYGTDDAATLINFAYQNMFDRAPDPSGLSYWTNALATGAYTFVNAVWAIAAAAAGSDEICLYNKYNTGIYFTTYIDSYGSPAGAWYTGTGTVLQNARAYIAAINASNMPTEAQVSLEVDEQYAVSQVV